MVGSSQVVAVAGSVFAGTTCLITATPTSTTSMLIQSQTCTIASGALSGSALTVNSLAAVDQYTVTVSTNAGPSDDASAQFIIVPSTTITVTSTSTIPATTTSTSTVPATVTSTSTATTSATTTIPVTTTSTSTVPATTTSTVTYLTASTSYTTTTSGASTSYTTTTLSTLTTALATSTIASTITTTSVTATSTSTSTSFITNTQNTVITATTTESATDQQWTYIYAIIGFIGVGCVCLLVVLLKLLGRGKRLPQRYTPEEPPKPIVE